MENALATSVFLFPKFVILGICANFGTLERARRPIITAGLSIELSNSVVQAVWPECASVRKAGDRDARNHAASTLAERAANYYNFLVGCLMGIVAISDHGLHGYHGW